MVGQMFQKRASELQAADIDVVLREEWQEGTNLELKGALPAKSPSGDSWLQSQASVGDYARNQLVKEVIAFANAHGGTMIVGITETSDKPARAKVLSPLPKCHELADRLRLMVRDYIEPRLSIIDVVGVATEATGEGVVVFQIPPSRLGPHRHMQTRHCYFRRGDRSEEMTMREIQDLTLHLDRGLRERERRLAERHEMFVREHQRFMDIEDHPTVGTRVTLVPLADLYMDRVFDNDFVAPVRRQFRATQGKQDRILNMPFGGVAFRPILRGTQSSELDGRTRAIRELHCDGLVEYSLLHRLEPPRFAFYAGWFMCLIANALTTVERFRRASGGADTEYGMELELWVRRGDVSVLGYADLASGDYGALPEGRRIFPHYSVGDSLEFSKLCAVIERDFWDYIGRRTSEESGIVVNFSDAF